jgi:hypothetical protein
VIPRFLLRGKCVRSWSCAPFRWRIPIRLVVWKVGDLGEYRLRSTVTDFPGLQGFHSLRGPRGRCGRYLDGIYGYISFVQVKESCCQIISRG